MTVEAWTVACGTCDHTWRLDGSWTVHATAAIESRPCPCCGAHTLQSLEPKPATRGWVLPKIGRLTPRPAVRFA